MQSSVLGLYIHAAQSQCEVCHSMQCNEILQHLSNLHYRLDHKLNTPPKSNTHSSTTVLSHFHHYVVVTSLASVASPRLLLRAYPSKRDSLCRDAPNTPISLKLKFKLFGQNKAYDCFNKTLKVVGYKLTIAIACESPIFFFFFQFSFK